MGLSADLLSQFAKITVESKRTKKESTVYGTVREYNDKLYVQIDGSEMLTPASTASDMKNGERVIVQIKDHSATIIGNVTSPSASSENLTILSDNTSAAVNNLIADNVSINDRLDVNSADIERLKADAATVENLNAVNAEIANLKTSKLDTATATATYATITNLNAANAEIDNLETKKLDVTIANATFATIENLNAANALIDSLSADKIDTVTANANYANINFANINMVSVENLFSKSGIIKDMVVNDTNITGELVGVTIKGDLIQANTLVADTLITQGEDGLYYKLNTDGIKVEAQQTEYNSLNGGVITTKSITASKIYVEDLVAFGATIGGYTITDESIYSGAKTSATNTTRGVFFGNDGQMAVGDSTNFVKYYKDQNGDYKLEISADSVVLSSSNTSIGTEIDAVKASIEDLEVRWKEFNNQVN